jgi:hypothetical protein
MIALCYNIIFWGRKQYFSVSFKLCQFVFIYIYIYIKKNIKMVKNITSYKISIDQKYFSNGNKGTRKQIGEIFFFFFFLKMYLLLKITQYKKVLTKNNKLPTPLSKLVVV